LRLTMGMLRRDEESQTKIAQSLSLGRREKSCSAPV
jgi:hypothetical protein